MQRPAPAKTTVAHAFTCAEHGRCASSQLSKVIEADPSGVPEMRPQLARVTFPRGLFALTVRQ